MELKFSFKITLKETRKMKRIMTMMLGLSLLTGATAMFADDTKPATDTAKPAKPAKKTKKTKKTTDTTTASPDKKS